MKGPSFKVLREKLTEEHIILLMAELGADEYEDRPDALIFPTICHNALGHSASKKLYYYKNNHLFHCYSECQCSFDIFELYERVNEINQREGDLYSFIDKIANLVDYDEYDSQERSSKYVSDIINVAENDKMVLKQYDPCVLDVFQYFPIGE